MGTSPVLFHEFNRILGGAEGNAALAHALALASSYPFGEVGATLMAHLAVGRVRGDERFMVTCRQADDGHEVTLALSVQAIIALGALTEDAHSPTERARLFEKAADIAGMISDTVDRYHAHYRLIAAKVESGWEQPRLTNLLTVVEWLIDNGAYDAPGRVAFLVAALMTARIPSPQQDPRDLAAALVARCRTRSLSSPCCYYSAKQVRRLDDVCTNFRLG